MTLLKDYISTHLQGEMKQTAMAFIACLAESNMTFYKDNCDCWKDKIYYWIKLNEQCVCFIAVKDPDEPDNQWTVWSDDSNVYKQDNVPQDIKTVAWKHIDFCGNCGSCGGGRQKMIFGRTFEKVCGCTFRVDNAELKDLPFLKKIVEMRKNEILYNGI